MVGTATPTADEGPGRMRGGESREGPITTSQEAADVIRTRIARRQLEEATPRGAPTATPPRPTVVVDEAGDAVMSSAQLGLMWPRRPAGVFDHQDAEVFCDGLELAGRDDWRLPEIYELERISRAVAAAWEPSSIKFLWSRTEHDIRGLFVLEFPEGLAGHRATGLGHVLCVRELPHE
jgi:hypothetical protein